MARHREKARAELDAFADETLAAAVKHAGLAQRKTERGYVRFDHQRRLQLHVLQAATSALQRAQLADAADFDTLHQRVSKAIGSIPGIGELTVYDTALRIGAKLHHLPTRVYLHSGTRQGAKALGLNWRATSLSVAECPSEFQCLEPHEIEDCLCIFKDHFHRPSNIGLQPSAAGAILSRRG